MHYCQLMTHQHHVTPKPLLMTLHDQEGYVAHHFYSLVLRNAMVSLIMPSAPYDADADANGVT